MSGARIEVIGRNGEPVAAATTDATGRAQASEAPQSPARENSPADPGPERFRLLLHAAASLGTQSGPLALRNRRSGKRDLRAAAFRVSLHRSRHLPARRNHASRHDHAHGRLEVFPHRPFRRRRDQRPARQRRAPRQDQAIGNGLRRDHVHDPARLSHRNLSGRRMAAERREAPGNAGQRVLQRPGIRTRPDEGPARSHPTRHFPAGSPPPT